MYTQKEFIEKSRKKFSEFEGLSDSQVLKTMLEKYPVYKSQISDYQEPGYFEELGTKALQGAGNLLTDTINVVGGGIARNVLGVEKENVKLFDYQKENENFKGGILQRSVDNFGEAFDTTFKATQSRNQRRTEERKNGNGNFFTNTLEDFGDLGRTGYDIGGNLVGAVTETVGDALMTGVATFTPDKTEERVKKYIAEQVQESKTLTGIVDWYNEYQETLEYMKQNAPEDYATHKSSISLIEGVADILTAKVGTTVGKGITNSAKNISKNMINKTTEAIEKITPLKEKYFGNTKDFTGKIDDFLHPKKDLDGTIGEVFKAQDEDLGYLKTTLKDLDTEDITTYKDFSKTLKDEIENIVKKQDDLLGSSNFKFNVDDLLVKTDSGDFEINFVKKAIDDLERVGINQNDIEILNLLPKFKKQEYTVKDLNDLARYYGTTFRDKAFKTNGDLKLGDISASYENTRTGLKNLVREKVGNNEMKNLDTKLHQIYKTKELIDKIVPEVQKLKNRVDERGLFEKIGNKIGDAVDFLSGGAIKGFMSRLIPRNAGLKTINYLDLEERLSDNLKRIQNFLKNSEKLSDDEFVDEVGKIFKNGGARTPINFEDNKKLQEWLGLASLKEMQPTTKTGSLNNYTEFSGNIKKNSSEPKYKVKEEEKNLRALHNLSEEKLEKVLKMGGMPMPSIAVLKKGVNFDDFGDITFVGKKSLVDPSYTKANKLYGADAYTPRVPEGELVLKKGRYIEDRIKQISDETGASSYEVEDYFKTGRGYYEREYPGIEKYKEEIDDLFERKIYKGITASGKPKYIDYTPENILKEMKSKGKGGESGIFSGSFNQMVGKTSKNIKNIEEARKVDFSNRTEELTNKYKSLNDEYDNLISELTEKTGISYLHFGKILSETYNKNLNTWKNNFLEYTDKIDLEDLAKVSDLLKQGRELPKSYIEGKPERFVRLNEFGYVLAPEEKLPKIQEMLKGTSLEGKVVGYKHGKREETLEKLIANDNDVRFKKAESNNYLSEEITQQEAKEIVEKYFKAEDVGVEFLDNIKTKEGLEALGMYKNELISFAKNPTKNVPEHEVLHAYFDLAIEPKKQREILDLIKSEKNFKTDLDAEEFLADSFADFVIGRREITGISNKIKNFLEDLVFKFKKFFGSEDKVEALFRDLEDIGKGKKKFEKVNLKSGNDEKYFIDENGKNIDINTEIGDIKEQGNLERINLKTFKGAEKFHNKYVRKISSSLAKKEKIDVYNEYGNTEKLNSIDIYEKNGFEDINGFLRKTRKIKELEIFKNSDDLKKVIYNLDNSFIPAEENIRVARGLEGNNEFLRRLEYALDNNWYSEGDIISDKGFLSTTIMADKGIDFTNRIMYVIDIPKGKKILPIKGKIHGKEEFEFLLPRNSKLKIKNIHTQDLKGYGESHYVIHFELK